MNSDLLRKGLDFNTNTISKSGRFYFECPNCKSERTVSVFFDFFKKGSLVNPINEVCSCGQKVRINLIAFIRITQEEQK